MNIERKRKRNCYKTIREELKDTSWIDKLPEDVKESILHRRTTHFKPDNLTFKQRLKREKIKRKQNSIKKGV